MDGNGFTAGADKANKAMKDTSNETDRMAKNMEARGKQAAAAFGAIRNQALALLGVFTAGVGIKKFTQDTVTSTASLGRMASNLNMSAKDLATWQLAAKNAGGSSESMASQIKKSSDEIAKAKMGIGSDSAQWFYRMGGSDIRAFKDGNDLLLEQSRIIGDIYKKDPARAMTMAANFGIGEDLFDLIKQGPEGIEKMRLAQEGLAAEMARASGPAEALRKQFDSLENKFKSTGVAVLTQFIPQIDKIIVKLDQFSKWVHDHREDISRWIEGAMVWFEDFIKTLDKGAQSLGGWKNVLLGLGALKILSMLSPLTALAGALFSIGKALGLISAGSGAVAVLATAAGVAVVGGVAAAVYSPSLNKGEDAALDAMRNAPTGAVRDKAIYAVEKLQGMGWTKEQAIGIAANLQAESSMDHTAVGDGGLAYGLAQWHPDRQGIFKKQYGMDIRKATFDQQLEFINWELNNTEKPAGNAIRKTASNQAAAKEVQVRYERPDPKNRDRDLAIRQGNAAALYGAMERRPDAAKGPVLPLNAVNVSNRAAAPGKGRGGASTSTSSSEVHIGKIDVITQSTDAGGISRELGESLGKYISPQANTGLR